MKLVLIGRGGHSKVVEEMAKQQNIDVIGYLDDKYPFFDVENNLYIGPLHEVSKLVDIVEEVRFIIAIGNNQVRRNIYEKMNLPNNRFLTLIHSTATVSHSAQIGVGSVVMANSVIQPNAKVGNHTIINTSSIIEHDNEISSFVHISPNATLTGTVSIGEGSLIGAGASIIPNIHIGEWSIVGAGSTVIKDLPSYCTAVGVPAKIKVKEDDAFVQHQ